MKKIEKILGCVAFLLSTCLLNPFAYTDLPQFNPYPKFILKNQEQVPEFFFFLQRDFFPNVIQYVS